MAGDGPGRRPADKTGQRFGALVVKEQATSHKPFIGRTVIRWLCMCDCGKECVVRADGLRPEGHTVSCGCKKTANIIATRRKQVAQQRQASL